MLKRTLTFNYDEASGLLVFNEGTGRFTGYAVPIAVDPKQTQDREFDRESRLLFQKGVKDAFARRAQGASGGLLEFEIPIKTPRMIKSIIGEGGAGLKVNGYRKITFGGRSQWNDGEQVIAGQSKFPSLQMEQISSFTINGTIGSKITVDVNQDSKRQESLANRIQLRYKGDEDDIIKTIELGNTNLALPSTRFSGYSQRIQGLFGVKTTAEIGGFRLTGIASQEKSSNKSASFKAGAESSSRIIRDWNYLDNQYFDLTRRDSVRSFADLLPGDSIINLKVYISYRDDQDQRIPKKTARMYVDPFDSTRYVDESFAGTVIEYGADRGQQQNPEDFYFLHRKSQYILFDQRIPEGKAVGVFLEYRRWNPDGTYQDISVGDLGSDTNSVIILKAIRTNNPRPSFVTWDYVWRNVYDVGRVDDPDGFNVAIYRGDANQPSEKDASDLSHLNGRELVTLLGLDENNDTRVDAFNDQMLDRYRGHLRFPDARPFDDPELVDRVPEIYDVATQQDRTNASKYYLEVNSASRQSEFQLGNYDIVPESETVTLNGRTLKKDIDYRISYEIGRISFLNEEALSASADVKVDYEFAPLISSQKKTLLGARGEYEFSRNFKIGAMALYKSEKETDRKPKLGEEQAQFLNLDVDASYSFDTWALTKLVDAIPFIETKQLSRVALQGEIGQSLPNPNVKGEASIDDFEGSKERYSLGITRTSWGPMSVPIQLDTLAIRRGALIWYNPYDQIPVTDIYDREVKAGENRTNILVLRFAPRADEVNIKTGSFAGIMKPFSKSAYDQTKTRFIELRMRGKVGIVHIDLGEISEDLNGDGNIDTEDTFNKNQLVEEVEDVGLDGLSDAQEIALCADSTVPDWYDCESTDPAGDNWSYTSDDRNNYERINGTENNREDQSRINRPDTEDLDNDGAVERRNNYFSWTIDLANNPFRVVGTERNDWYSVRIPFQDSTLYERIGASPDRGNIKMMRIWLNGVETDTSYVEIAEIELTKNSWEAAPLLPVDKIRTEDTRFEVSVINTEEDSIYTPPPSVEGFYDKTTGLREREQSLRFDFLNLAPGDSGMAAKIPFKSQDLSGYNKLEMWIHGDLPRENLLFFFRFGPDERNYYEFRTTLNEGWDPNHSVNIVFDELTQVKLKLQELQQQFPDTLEYSGGKFRVFGNPSITRVKYYALGITNSDSLQSGNLLTGNIWIDELRATQVRRDKGVAAFVTGSVTFADVASFSANYSKQDEFFRTLTQADRRDLGSGSKNTNYGFSASFNIDKFFPPNDGVSIPFSYNWNRSELSPRLITGSDIVVPNERIESEKSITTTYGFSISERWNKKSGNPLYSVLLNKFTSSFSWNKTIASSPTVPVNDVDRYNAKGRYTVTSPLRSGLKMFSWLRGIPLVPKRVLETQLNPVPNRLSFDGDVTRSEETRVNNFGVSTYRYSRILKGSFETGLNPLTGWELGYRFTTDRDISNPKLVKFSFNPKSIMLGQERRYDESFTANYSPNIVPFVTGTKLGFTSSHGETFEQGGAEGIISNERRISNSRSFTAGATFNLQKLIGQYKAGVPKRTPPAKAPVKNPQLDSLRKNTGADSLPKPKLEEKPSAPGTPFYSHGLRFIHFFTDQVDPVSVSYKWDERLSLDGFIERPSLMYRLGFSSDPQARRVATTSTNNLVDGYGKGRTYSARSGVRLPMGFSVGANWAYNIAEGSNKQTRDDSRTWPDLGLKFGKLDWLMFPKFFTKTLSLDSKYSVKKNWQFNVSTGQKRSEIHTVDYSPLLSAGWDWKFASGLRTTIGYSKSTASRSSFRDGANQDGSLTVLTKDFTTGITFKTSYSFRGGSNVWLPLFGRVKIQSNLSLDLDISKRRTRSENHTPTKDPETGLIIIDVNETSNRSEFTVQPAATYNFSTNIKGGMRARWSDSDDIKSGGRHVRELEMWVEIRF
ncbi:MAG: cell surface protein SprA [Candidatus Zixiibacteriota bacterium]